MVYASQLPIFLTSVLTMGSSSKAFGSTLLPMPDEPPFPSVRVPRASLLSPSEHGVQKVYRKGRRRRQNRMPKSTLYRNINIPQIPPFNPVIKDPDKGITYDVRGPCTLEIFEQDPSIVHNHQLLCRSHSVS